MRHLRKIVLLILDYIMGYKQILFVKIFLHMYIICDEYVILIKCVYIRHINILFE